MSNVERVKGFTLLEMIIVVSLILIIATLAVPSGQAMVEANERRTVVAALVGAFSVARNTSIQEKVPVTLCPLDENARCIKDWSRPVTVFRDPGRLRRLVSQDQIIRHVQAPAAGIVIANSANRRYFGFRGTGMARSAIGNLIWCPDDGDVRQAVQLRINMGGRLQQARDRNGDGIVEGADGRNITCS
ncbi:MAG: GspH/FimT family pseudopilin [Marinobacter sp.]|uniref:GspH/FimT family pseudopilin n=1 Tax=Marinobacter sp. TaxID=50741 RepID=UPI00299E3093|nr:GspH/FimT family pseudopilin [Marinobacter sp.]MDX1634640.1 GspH/FimT family pseudopilin [Marinobacter sp.]